jgi:hypothetical protein
LKTPVSRVVLILQSLHEGQGINAVGRVFLELNGTSAVSHVGTKIKLKTLQQLSGRGGDTQKRFNEAMKRAKKMLEKAAAATIEIDPTGLVTITHKLSPSQIRHAARKPIR